MLEQAGSEEKLPSLFDLWQRYHLGVTAFAEAAGVDVSVVRDMLTNKPVSLPDAQKVFVQVSKMLDRQYTTLNTAVSLLNTTQELQNEIAYFLRERRSRPPLQNE